MGALGTLVWDTNWHPSLLSPAGEPLRQWGGAAYSFASLSAACPPGWVVEPIVHVGADLADRAAQHLATLPHLEPGRGVVRVPEPNNRVELRYRDAAERLELLTGGVPAWNWDELRPLLPRLDALYVNFISGFEVELETVERVRREFTGPIYTDLHSLFLGVGASGARTPRRLPDWERWVACFDSIQINEHELALLVGDAEPDRFLAELLRMGPRVVCITLGGQGVRFLAQAELPLDPLRWRAHLPQGHTVVRGTTPPPLGELSGDPTGCGDVWGAGFVAGTLGGLSLESAIERAQRLAGAKITHPDSGTLRAHLRRALREPIGA